MSGTDELKNMLLTFRVSELQMLLGYAGLNKTGRKTELQARAIELLKNKSVPHLTQVHAKIRELYKTIQQGGPVTPQQAVVAQQQGVAPPVGQQSPVDNLAQATGATGATTPSLLTQQGQQRSMIPPQMNPNMPGFLPLSSRSSLYGTMYGYQPKVAGLATPTTSVYPIQPDVRLKRLPFYDVLGELLKPSSLLPNGGQRGQEGSFIFYLTPQQATDVAMNREVGPGTKNEYLVQVQLRFCLLETTCEQDDVFPPGVIVKVNSKVCPLPNPIPTNKPGVDAKRPPRPVNISSLVKLSPSVANHVSVSWTAEYGRGYVIAINLVRKLTASDLLQRLKAKGIRHADFTTGLIKEKLCEDADTEIATTSLRVSLLCPLGKMRMATPCRSTTCTHLQCFDASLFLQMNEKKPTWTCPVCDKPALFDNLVIDGYFQDVLNSNRLAPDCHEIQLHQDGTWSSHVSKKDNSCVLSPSRNSSIPNKTEPIEEILDDNDDPPEQKPENEDVEKKRNVIMIDLTSDTDDDEVETQYQSPTPPIKPDQTALSDSSNLSTGRSSANSPSIITLDSPSPPASPVAPAQVPNDAPEPPVPSSPGQPPAPPSPPHHHTATAPPAPQPQVPPQPQVYPTIVPTTLPNRPFVMQIRMPPDSRYQPY